MEGSKTTEETIAMVEFANDTKEVRVAVNGTTPTGEKDDKDKKEEKDEKMVGMRDLFRYADWVDITYMIFGGICACTHGTGLPLFMIFFGDMIHIFIDNAKSAAHDAKSINLTTAGMPDSWSIHDVFDEMKTLLLYCSIVGLVVWFVAYGQLGFWLLAAHRQAHKIRLDLFRAILRQDIGWFDTHENGELNMRLNDDVNKIQEGTGDKIGDFLQWLATFITSLVIGFTYGWKLLLIFLALTSILVISWALLGRVRKKLTTCSSSAKLKAYTKPGAIAEEVFGAIRMVIAFGGEPKECKRYKTNLEEARKAGLKKSLVSGGRMGLFIFMVFCVCATTFWYGSKLVREDPDYDDISIVFFSVMICAFALGNAVPNLATIATARGAAYTVYQIINRVPPIDSSATEGQKPAQIKGNIEFRDVAFRYPSRPYPQVLQGLDLKINVGQTVALVGASCCGKSTIVHLLQRFYDTEQGAVFIDGINIRDLNVTWLREHIGLVSQEPVLFSTTIAENIHCGREGVTQEEIERACKEANAHNFICELPQGYKTLVGERGAQLRGSQKQCIVIARALVSDPKILVLDEATSALDTESEASVQAALDKARIGRTTLVITHRLSTIQTADVIVGIEDGKVAEMGTHDELMAHQGIYYLLSQVSVKAKAAKEKKEEKNLPDPSMMRVLRLNAPEAVYIVLGCVAAIINGIVLPVFGLKLPESLALNAKPPDVQAEDALCYSVMFLVIGIGYGLVILAQFFLFAVSGERLTLRIRGMAFKCIIGQDMEFFDNHRNSIGALNALLASDASAVQGVSGAHLGMIVQYLSSIGAGLVIGFIISWQLTLGILGIMINELVKMKLSNISQQHFETASKHAKEAIENMRTVASLNTEQAVIKRYEDHLIGPYKKALRRALLTDIPLSFTKGLTFSAFSGSFALGVHLIQKNNLSFGDMYTISFVILMSAIGASLAIAFAPDYDKGKSAAARILALLDSEPSIDTEKGDTIPGFSGSLEYNDVKFLYPTHPPVPVLESFSLRAEPGQTIAVVGSSGCRKSTTLQLTQRFYDAADGVITLDGKPIKSLNIAWLRSQMGIVSQESVLFDCSIRENIEYGDNSRQVPMDEVIAAARAANIHDFISSLPDGYETNCGDKSSQLSRGQKQQVAIARALVRNPKILLLDLDTSDLDTESEKIVQDALDRARAGRTCLMIGHRLSTIEGADRIVVIRGGQVTEQGTHAELMAQKGYYHKLSSIQQQQT